MKDIDAVEAVQKRATKTLAATKGMRTGCGIEAADSSIQKTLRGNGLNCSRF